jgi:hypothetical protein
MVMFDPGRCRDNEMGWRGGLDSGDSGMGGMGD